jgi:hypothetical protein
MIRERWNLLRGAGVLIALLGCGGGTAATDGGAGDRGGALGSGGAAGISGAGSGGVAGAGTTGRGGASGFGGSAGRSATAGANGAAGTNGATGTRGQAGAGTAGRSTGGNGGASCAPDILIVQDRGGSMNDDQTDQACRGGCGTFSKWSIVTTAVTNFLQATGGSVNWGLKFFSDDGACSASMAPTVPVGPSNGSAIANAIAATTPSGDTPTRDAINTGAAYLQTLVDTNPKFLLLVTDGISNCPAGCAGTRAPSVACTINPNASEDMAADQAVAMAASQGIKTFVLGISAVTTQINELNQLAISGGEAQTGGATSYYAVGDEPTVDAALTTIVGIAACP